MERGRTARLFLLVSAASLLWLCAGVFYHATRPIFGPETAEFPGKTLQQSIYPFLLQKAPKAKFVLKQYLQIPHLYPTTYEFYPQDFLWDVKVNGQEVKVAGLPLSAASLEGRSIDLAPFLHPGLNELELNMEVKWGEATLRIGVSPWDKYSLILLLLVSSATYCTAAFLCSFLGLNIRSPEILIILVGIFLRYIYLLGTPYFVRSFDFWGHADYLDYVSQNLSIPPLHSNWESFQPPFYYLVLGGLTKMFLFWGMPEEQRYDLWQGVSLAISIGVLLTGLLIANTLYENHRKHRFYLLAVLAVAPPLIFNSARIGNDCLVTLLEFLWFASLLRYWRRPSLTTWTILSVIAGLALVTKANALILIPISVICLLLDRRQEPRSKAFRIAVLLALSFGIASGYYLPRAIYGTAVNTFVVGNLPALNPASQITGVLAKSLIFNPFKVVRYPFDEPWGPRHDYFLEVLLKTMILGSWIKGASYKLLARLIMLTALLLIPPFLLGFGHALRERAVREWPMIITLGAVFLSQWVFLQVAPFLSTQDFRYSVILLVPFAHYFLRSGDYCSHKWKGFIEFVLQLAILNEAIYVVVLSFGS